MWSSRTKHRRRKNHDLRILGGKGVLPLMGQVQIAVGNKDHGYTLVKVKDEEWVACESRLPAIGKWVLLRIRWNGRYAYYAARIDKTCRYWITRGFIEHCIRLEKRLKDCRWAELPEWWEGFEDA